MEGNQLYSKCTDLNLNCIWDFPGSIADKNPLASAGGMGSIPGPGRLQTPRGNKAHVPQLLSLPT